MSRGAGSDELQQMQFLLGQAGQGVGFLDDFIKISKQRSLGLRTWAKLGAQSLVAIVFAARHLVTGVPFVPGLS